MTVPGWLRDWADVVTARLRLLRLFVAVGWLSAGATMAIYSLSALLPAAAAIATGRFIAVLSDGAHRRQVVGGVALLVVLALVARAADVIRDLLGAALTRRIDGWIRHRVRQVAHAPAGIAHLETAEFHDDAIRASDAGHGIGRTRSPGTAAVGQVVLMFRFLSAFVGTALLATFSVWLAGALLVASLVIRARLRRQWTHLVSVKDEDAAGQRGLAYLADVAVLTGAKEVRVFGLADWLLGRRRALAHRVHGPTWRQLWRVLRSQKFVICLGIASVAAAMAVPAAAALSGRIGSGQLVTALGAAFTVLAISSTGDEAFDIEYGMGAVRAVDRLSSAHAGATAMPATTVRSAAVRRDEVPVVRFEDVRFGYTRGRAVLDGLSFTLHPGEKLAVVGRNGVGKTTLIKLLGGLYPPTAGRITVDGRDLADLDPSAWRRRLAVVFQDFLRYPGTVADNVALSAPESLGDRDGIVEALRAAGAIDLVEGLPNGIDTLLWREGATGTDLSGGQWQRIAIARALFAVAHGRRILVLDEPTAHLDVAAEAAFYERVTGAVRDATVILISHRLSTVRPADRIVLMRDGRVAEDGSHDELMSLPDGEYRRLFALQAARFTGEAPDRPRVGVDQ